MSTPWTDPVPVDHPLREYPRPQLTRPDRASLKGIWDFAVTSRDAGQPAVSDARMRVPFVLKQDAPWKVRPGLANRLRYSFGSRNYPGEYLRHINAELQPARSGGTQPGTTRTLHRGHHLVRRSPWAP